MSTSGNPSLLMSAHACVNERVTSLVIGPTFTRVKVPSPLLFAMNKSSAPLLSKSPHVAPSGFSMLAPMLPPVRTKPPWPLFVNSVVRLDGNEIVGKADAIVTEATAIAPLRARTNTRFITDLSPLAAKADTDQRPRSSVVNEARLARNGLAANNSTFNPGTTSNFLIARCPSSEASATPRCCSTEPPTAACGGARNSPPQAGTRVEANCDCG